MPRTILQGNRTERVSGSGNEIEDLVEMASVYTQLMTELMQKLVNSRKTYSFVEDGLEVDVSCIL